MPPNPEWLQAAAKVSRYYNSITDLWDRAARCEPITVIALGTDDQEIARVTVSEPDSVDEQQVVWSVTLPAGTVAERTLLAGLSYGVEGNMRRITFERWGERGPTPIMPDMTTTVTVRLGNSLGTGYDIDEHFPATPNLPALTRRTRARSPGAAELAD